MERRERGRKKWIERKRREDKGIRWRTKTKKREKGDSKRKNQTQKKIRMMKKRKEWVEGERVKEKTKEGRESSDCARIVLRSLFWREYRQENYGKSIPRKKQTMKGFLRIKGRVSVRFLELLRNGRLSIRVSEYISFLRVLSCLSLSLSL